ncbi:hypothetical protein [Halalkalirubrum salinum]|uniref:hypothetical protein n=1 Tax=Halalkalirubrum salinum TaxID=2563889 RepID=UPI0010FB219A|nr:hypothetical protein [Halalkalirubrum salinum]
MDGSDTPQEDKEDSSIENMMQHLPAAKERKKSKSNTGSKKPRRTGLQRKVRQHSNVAILSKNFSDRLDELVESDAITHRSGKKLKSAESAVDAHGRLPIYYRSGDTVTHIGVITDIIINPDPDSTAAKKFRDHISKADTYSEYNDELDTTTYIVKNGKKLDEPFSMTQLNKVSDNEPVDENFWRSPAYVFQRDGDFDSVL